MEMNHSPVKAHFLLIKYPDYTWGVYLEDPFGNNKFLFSKNADLKVVEKDMETWAQSMKYDSFEYRIEGGSN